MSPEKKLKKAITIFIPESTAVGNLSTKPVFKNSNTTGKPIKRDENRKNKLSREKNKMASRLL